DWYDENYYSNSPPKNPPGPGTGSKRLLRGGDWNNGSSRLRVAYRDINLPKIRGLNYGFRCVLGSNITPGPSAGGDFTSGEAAPLPPADDFPGDSIPRPIDPISLPIDPVVIPWPLAGSSSGGVGVILIPAGSFEMGDHFNEGKPHELPLHTVELDAFYMDRTEITVGH
ncbi:MAG: SUMF1/EgtB/PvdO family nonheme iron enzyme, partial [Candidatus Poribacteria bacterium]|nr:SUMF1/EgtB/PvdO family nonheme iron enzyme [Candidatus Poribacteria bacterium]